MKIGDFLKSAGQASNLILTDLVPSIDGRFVKATDDAGGTHVMSTKNIVTAVEKGTAVVSDDQSQLTVKPDNYNIDTESGLTLVNYGNARFSADSVKFK